MFYTVYRIKNTINGKVYVGVHKTSNINDSYMGSGKALNEEYLKVGKEHFNKRILRVFDNPKEMFDLERKIVSRRFVDNDSTYNQHTGGTGGFEHLNDGSEEHLIRSKKGGSKSHLNRTQEDYNLAGKKSKETYFKRTGRYGTFKGLQHTEETKAKIGKTNSANQKGSKNSQFGSMWITDGTINKKIKQNETMPTNFRKGRVQQISET